MYHRLQKKDAEIALLQLKCGLSDEQEIGHSSSNMEKAIIVPTIQQIHDLQPPASRKKRKAAVATMHVKSVNMKPKGGKK